MELNYFSKKAKRKSKISREREKWEHEHRNIRCGLRLTGPSIFFPPLLRFTRKDVIEIINRLERSAHSCVRSQMFSLFLLLVSLEISLVSLVGTFCSAEEVDYRNIDRRAKREYLLNDGEVGGSNRQGDRHVAANDGEDGPKAKIEIGRVPNYRRKNAEPVVGGDGENLADGAAARSQPRSLVEACARDGRRLCSEFKDRSNLGNCLEAKLEDISDEDCVKWVSARKLCVEDAKKSGKCKSDEAPGRCLRKVSDTDVSVECSSSHFFRAIQMYKRYRRRNSGIAGTGGGTAGRGKNLYNPDRDIGS